jgi:hypothetical protein
MSSVHCGIAPPAAVRLLKSEGHQFSEFTVLGFLPTTAGASVVPQHGSVHLGLGDFFFKVYSSRSAVFCLNRLTSGRIIIIIIIVVVVVVVVIIVAVVVVVVVV